MTRDVALDSSSLTLSMWKATLDLYGGRAYALPERARRAVARS